MFSPERVREEHLSTSVAGVASVRVSVKQLRETDSGAYTCEVPQYHQSAVAVVNVEHSESRLEIVAKFYYRFTCQFYLQTY